MKIAAAALSPLLLHPVLIYVSRAIEQRWALFAEPSVTPITDFALPVISTLIGLALITRVTHRTILIASLVYVPLMVTAVLYSSMFIFGYAWRDFP